MDYKEKYEQAIERARKIKSGEGLPAPEGWDAIDVIFPELRESEDEKIRKKLILFFSKLPYINIDKVGLSAIEAITWLEKQKPVEWSEEDEDMREGIITTLKANIRRLYLHDAQGRADHEAKISWLKSLKSQPHWKPSEEEIKALSEVIEYAPFSSYIQEVRNLLDELKILRYYE